MIAGRTGLWILLVAALAGCGRANSTQEASEQQAPVLAGMERLCANPSLQGVKLPRITESNPRCGIRNPVQVFYVSGVEMNPAPVLNCDAANALAIWVNGAAIPEVAAIGERLTRLRVGSHYACRTRNSVRGAKLSEHATGNAIDITAFTLASGKVYTILEGWSSRAFGAVMRKIYRRACGTFGTTLGPDADAAHQDNLHFDVASYRGGAYCR